MNIAFLYAVKQEMIVNVLFCLTPRVVVEALCGDRPETDRGGDLSVKRAKCLELIGATDGEGVVRGL